METPAIKIQNLQFSYAENSGVVFSDFNLTIKAGERFGLLGPNGAGKTTLMNLMTGVLKKQSGAIIVSGKDIDAESVPAKKSFGFIPQQHSFYQELTPAENLEFFGAWAGLAKKEIAERTDELLGILGLLQVKNKAVAKFSGGMKSRVNLAIGVIHRPQILFLDEPTSGVDVQTRHAILTFLKELSKQGTTLVYTSHLLSEAETLCTRVALLDHGKIVVEDELTALLQPGTGSLETLFLNHTGRSYRDADV